MAVVAGFGAATQLICVLAAACVVATGCGGGRSGSDASSSASFAADYLSASHTYRTQLAQLQSQASGAAQQGTTAEIAVFRGMLDVTNTTVKQMDRLHATAKLKAQFEQFDAALHDQASSLQKVLTAVDQSDNPAINKAVTDLSGALQKGLTLQRELDNAVGATSPTTG